MLSTTSTIDLLTLIFGRRQTAEKLLQASGGSLRRLMSEQNLTQPGDLFAGESTRRYHTAGARAKLEAALELARRYLLEDLYHGDALTSPGAVRDYLRLTLGAREHEVFVAIFLDAQHRVIAVEEMFRGTLTQTSVYPREVVKAALGRHNCAAVIFAHNHPSGVAQPSQADEVLTRALKEALALVEVKVLDHFIIAGNQSLGFAERGLL